MEQISAQDEQRLLDQTKAFTRKCVAAIIRNLVLGVIKWTLFFAAMGFFYSRLYFTGGELSDHLQSAGTVGLLVIYIGAGLAAGVFLGSMAGIRGVFDDLTEVSRTVIDIGFVKALPADRETISVSEIELFLARIAPDGSGLKGWPERLVTKRFRKDFMGRVNREGLSQVKVDDVKSYLTDRLVDTAVGDMRMKVNLFRWLAYLVIVLFLALPILIKLVL